MTYPPQTPEPGEASGAAGDSAPAGGFPPPPSGPAPGAYPPPPPTPAMRPLVEPHDPRGQQLLGNVVIQRKQTR